jgi:DNA mismatch repair protein MutS2
LNFGQIYYFAKNKGSTNKGAFETLLTQMANIGAGETRMDGTLILADEIESVTEPGVAGKIIAATAEYFVSRGAYVVMATHLGAEIAKSVPDGVRIDGIEARGLDENLNLIVNHNPVLGRLASSTPELIIERMARGGAGKGKGDGRYFEFLFERMKRH